MKLVFIFLLSPWFLKAQDVPNPNEFVIDKIVCEGNSNTSCDLIQKQIYLNVGDKVNEEELSNAKIRLQLKNLFNSVNIFMKKSSERGHVDLVIEVIEGNPFFMEVEYGSEGSKYSNFNRRNVSIGNRNLLGLGKILRFSYSQNEFSWQNSKYFVGTLSYVDPNLFGSKKLFFNFNASFERPLNSPDSADFGFYDKNDHYSALLGIRFFDFSYFSISQMKKEEVYRFQNSDDASKRTSIVDSITYGWNSEDDTNFSTSGSRFALSYSEEHQQSLTDSYINNDRSYEYLFFKKNWSLAPKNYLSLSSNIYRFNDLIAPEVQSNSSLLYSYQLKDRLNGLGSRSRLFVDVNPIATKDFSTVNFRAGYITEFAGFGLLKLGLTYWGNM
jgi:outer membrane protein assembly factor BamA